MTEPSKPEIDLTVPDLGGAKDVTVIEVLVHPGDRVEVDAPLVTLESDKATMDVPATAAGSIGRVLVKAGDKVAIDPSHPCGQCDYCRGGRMNLCRKMFFLGSASIFPHAQGLFARLAGLTVVALGLWTLYEGWVFFDIMRGLSNW